MELSEKDVQVFKKSARVYRALNHKLRQKILHFLNGKEANVTAIYVHFRIEQSVASQHLRILRDAKLVKTRKDKKEVFYQADGDRIEKVRDISEKLLVA
jgi:DNA-binding transcriptional ArsR family regulator